MYTLGVQMPAETRRDVGSLELELQVAVSCGTLEDQYEFITAVSALQPQLICFLKTHRR